MYNTIISITLVIASILLGVFYAIPEYHEMQTSRERVQVLDDALQIADNISSTTQELLAKVDAVSSDDLQKAHEMIPQQFDAVRTVNDISHVATRYGLTVDNPTVDTLNSWTADDLRGDKNVSAVGQANAKTINGGAIKAIHISFSVDSTYETFTSFIKDLEKSLKVIDIVGVDFSSNNGSPQEGGGFTYKVDIVTYALSGARNQ